MNDNDQGYFEILAPAQWTMPVVFNSPHSGSQLPDHFLHQSRLAASVLHSSEDAHVDALFMGCLQEGAPLLRCLVSRSYIDLNREPYEFDSRMFDERLPAFMNVASPRVASGLGTIPRTVGDGQVIYDRPLALHEALSRIENIYRPYHRTLTGLLQEAYRATGTALLLDCHSMPSSAVPARNHGTTCEIVLGDRFGSACDGEIVDLVEQHFLAQGLRAQRNRPYAGGFFTESHGRPREGRHALQIEINRALYMDEMTRTPNGAFSTMRECLDALARKLATYFLAVQSQSIAAE